MNSRPEIARHLPVGPKTAERTSDGDVDTPPQLYFLSMKFASAILVVVLLLGAAVALRPVLHDADPCVDFRAWHCFVFSSRVLVGSKRGWAVLCRTIRLRRVDFKHDAAPLETHYRAKLLGRGTAQ